MRIDSDRMGAPRTRRLGASRAEVGFWNQGRPGEPPASPPTDWILAPPRRESISPC